jgi:hypothetical protein
MVIRLLVERRAMKSAVDGESEGLPAFTCKRSSHLVRTKLLRPTAVCGTVWVLGTKWLSCFGPYKKAYWWSQMVK